MIDLPHRKNSMVDIQNCYLCGSGNFEVIFKSNLHEQKTLNKNFRFACTRVVFAKHGQIVRCNNCGLVYNNPREEDDTLLDRYRCVKDPDYLLETSSRRATYEPMLDRIMEYVPAGKLLDVGCYTGIFLQMARERGFDVAGVEPSKWTADYAISQFGFDVFNGTIEEFKAPADSFDIITMWDVIEHLVNPLEDLKQLNRIMKTGGLLAFSTHNIESNAMKLLKGYYPFLVEMHVCHFSPHTLRSILSKAGFELEKIEKHTRIVRLGYLADKIVNYSSSLADLVQWGLKKSNLENRLVAINYLGLINAYAKKIKNVDPV